MKRILAFIVMLIMGAMLGCAHQTPLHLAQPHPQGAGAITEVTRVGAHRALTLRGLLCWAGLPEHVRVQTGVEMYRVAYRTTNYDGTPTVASGLVAFPKKGTLKGVVSYQHGTRTSRHDAPSAPSLSEGVLGAAVFAGNGFLFVAPDYLGLGAGNGVHPYVHAASSATATIDLLRAAESLCAEQHRAWPEGIYLTGFSEGGFATAAAQRELEGTKNPEFRVMASAPIAPALDLAGIALPYAIKNNSTLYLAYIAQAYSIIYKKDLAAVVAAPYAARLPELFDGEHGEDDVTAGLPKNARELFTPEFLAAYDAGKPTWLTEALKENQVNDWTPSAPTRLYYGSRDTDVSPEESQNAAAAMKQRGGDVTAVCVGPLAHVESAMLAIPKVLQWFDTISAAALK